MCGSSLLLLIGLLATLTRVLLAGLLVALLAATVPGVLLLTDLLLVGLLRGLSLALVLIRHGSLQCCSHFDNSQMVTRPTISLLFIFHRERLEL
jgi:hypothetical protein